MQYSPPSHRQLDYTQVQFLERQGFSSGLIRAIAINANRFPLRLWVIDNSSSMQTKDAHLIQGSTFHQLLKVDCTRWQEAQDSVLYFCQMASTLQLPTRFIMLNDLGRMFGPSTFSVAEQQQRSNVTSNSDLNDARAIIGRAYPSGVTPLAKHITQIRNTVAPMAQQLVRERKTISVVIATDGLPSDESGNEGHIIFGQFVQALRSLEGLLVWVIIRLCTDDERVFEFYNSIDAQVNLPYDVLDDFFGEALEVYLQNPWLNYALPLHRFREFGMNFHVLDELDEQALSLPELRQLCQVLFAGAENLPDPSIEWGSFLRSLANLMANEKWHYNPISRSLCPWIDLQRLHLVYGRNSPFPPDLLVYKSQQYARMVPPTQPTSQGIEQHAFSTSSASQPSPPLFPTSNARQSTPDAHHTYQQRTPNLQQPYQYQIPTPPQQQGPSFHQSDGGQEQQQQQRYTQPQPRMQEPKGPETFHTADKYQDLSAISSALPSATDDETTLKHNILRWATRSNNLKPIDELLRSIQNTFPPAFSMAPHPYFQKFKPFSQDALSQREFAVIKRATRKAKFFLHPDKLPHDFSKQQRFLCKMLWDIMADAWDAFERPQTKT